MKEHQTHWHRNFYNYLEIIFPVLFFKSFYSDFLEMHIYLVICRVKTIFNAVYEIIQGFEIFLDDFGKKCHLNSGNDKNQVTFFYMAAS